MTDPESRALGEAALRRSLRAHLDTVAEVDASLAQIEGGGVKGYSQAQKTADRLALIRARTEAATQISRLGRDLAPVDDLAEREAQLDRDRAALDKERANLEGLKQEMVWWEQRLARAVRWASEHGYAVPNALVDDWLLPFAASCGLAPQDVLVWASEFLGEDEPDDADDDTLVVTALDVVGAADSEDERWRLRLVRARYWTHPAIVYPPEELLAATYRTVDGPLTIVEPREGPGGFDSHPGINGGWATTDPDAVAAAVGRELRRLENLRVEAGPPPSSPEEFARLERDARLTPFDRPSAPRRRGPAPAAPAAHAPVRVPGAGRAPGGFFDDASPLDSRFAPIDLGVL